MINIEITGDTIQRLTRALGEISNGVPKVLARSINHALSKGKTACVRAVTNEYLIKPTPVRATLNVRRASYGSPSGSLGAKSTNLPVTLFEVKPPGYQQTRKKKRPITVRIKKQGGGQVIEQGFLAPTGPRGHGAFERAFHARVPLREFYTIGPASMLSSPSVSAEVERVMQLELDSEIDRQAELLLRKL